MPMNESALANRTRAASAIPVAPGYALQTAEQAYRRVLADQPGHFRALCGLAVVRSQLGALDEARDLIGQAVDVAGPSAEDHVVLGTTFIRINDLESAHRQFEMAVALDEGHAEARFHLANVLCGRDDVAEAVIQYERVLAIDPNNAEARQNLGLALQRLGQFESALACHQAALAISPKSAAIHIGLGDACRHLGRHDDAIVQYAQALATNPGLTDAHNNLANVLRRRGRLEEAIEHYKDTLRLKPTYVSAQRSLGEALQSQHQIDGAIVCYRAALAIEPGDAPTLNRLASALLIVGRLDEASRAYERAIDIAPENIGIQHNYAAVKPFADGDRRLARLEELHACEDQLSDEQRIVLHFTLGKAYADLKDEDRSFRHLDAGNRLKRRQVTYDERATLMLMPRIRDAFTKDLLKVRSNVGHHSEAPVFVVGMPRSGTSLVEQILASHPRVFGAGEVDHFAAATSDVAQRRAGAYPDMLAKISDEDFRELGKTYVERLSGDGAAKDRIVDKLPSNFLFAGLIHLALPRARIIHVKRNAIDTCVSCYSLLFAEDQPFTYDLGELGRYYKA